MDEAEYERRFGSKPEQDDLLRVNCDRAGTLGHSLCGVCEEHKKPRFECGCSAKRERAS